MLGETGADSLFVKLQLIRFRWPDVLRRVGSVENLLLVEKLAVDAGVMSREFAKTLSSVEGDVAQALRRRAAEAVERIEHFAGIVDDLALLQHLAGEPLFHKAANHRDLLEQVIAMDL